MLLPNSNTYSSIRPKSALQHTTITTILFVAVLLCVSFVDAAPSKTWKITKHWSVDVGPYLWEVGESYGMIGHLVKGRVTVFDTNTWKKVTSKSLGRGQVYVAVQKKWGLVALTTQKKLLLVALPSLRIHRTYPLSFYPYGVHLETPSSTTSKPSSRPTTSPTRSLLPQHAIVADQIGGKLVRVSLATGKMIQRRNFRWPLRTRWSGLFGVLIPISGPLLLLNPNWSLRHKWSFSGVVGDVALQGKRLALAYGDTRSKKGSLHLYQLPNTKPIWTASTYSRPRSIAIAGKQTLTLTEKGTLQVFSPQGKLTQTQSLGSSGIVIRCHKTNVCSALLPMERKLVKIE